MSRNHLIVEGTDSAFRIRDVGSANGTFVNGSKVSLIELCNGDRIKAGTTVFEVEITEEEGQRVETAAAPVSGDETHFPTRTLSSEELEIDQEVTRRFVKPVQIQSESLGASDDQETLKPLVKEDQGVNVRFSSAPLGAAADRVVPFGDNVQSPAAAAGQSSLSAAAFEQKRLPDSFLMHFRRSKEHSGLWHQVKAGPSTQGRVLDALLRADIQVCLSLIVNRYQLDKLEQGTLDFAVSTAESRALTHALYLLSSKRLEIPLEFYKRCLGKDAVVCVASDQQLDEVWLHGAIDTLSYPSLLYQMVVKSPNRASQLLQGVIFLLFEAPRDDRTSSEGGLCLLYDAGERGHSVR